MDLPLSADSASGLSDVENDVAAPAGGGDVALLLDWENLKESLRQHCSAQPNIKALLATARQHGPLAVARAYADWSDSPRLGADAPNLVRNAIDPIYTIGGRLKNSADIRLAVDAIALCERSPQIATYIIGSGDGGLVSVINYLRLRGRTVVVIAVGPSLSGYLRDAADRTLRYEDAIEPTLTRSVPTSPQTPPPSATAPPQAPPPTWEEITGWVVALLAAQGPGPYPFTILAHQLKERHGFTATLVAMKFRQCMERIAETSPIRITSTANSAASLGVRNYFAELVATPQSRKATVRVSPPAEASPCVVAPLAQEKGGQPAAAQRINSAMQEAALAHAFVALPHAVATARQGAKNGLAHYPNVQFALQHQLGCTLSELGQKPGAFFAEAARRGIVQTAVLTNGASKSEILLLPGEPLPARA